MYSQRDNMADESDCHLFQFLSSIVNAVHSTLSNYGGRKITVWEYSMIGKKAKIFNPLICFGHLIQGYQNWK